MTPGTFTANSGVDAAFPPSLFYTKIDPFP